jgi:predicted MFS family arabinose efflux permease
VSATDATRPWLLYTERRRWGLLAILFLVSMSNYLDRHIIAVLLEPIKLEFQVSDTMLGLLVGFCFALFYAIAGMPVARWADRGNRRTVITLALTIWSIMTGLCGFAQTFWQLALARVGVGAGESGAIPPAQSLIADYFPPERRATALAIFTAAASAGYLLGIGLGGYIAATRGWRTAFLLVGSPGLVLALIARLTLAEPRLKLGFQSAGRPPEDVSDAIFRLRRKISFMYALGASLLYFVFSYGVLTFVPSFLTRVLHASLPDVSVTYGTVAAVGSVLGTVGGGWAADGLGRRDIRWLAWIPAIEFVIAGPVFILAFSVHHLWIFMALALIGNALVASGLPAVFAATHAVCGSRRRATAIAIVLFSATLFGGGLGPLMTGALSDALSAVYGAAGLRYSLMTMVTVLMLSGIACYGFGRAMPRDLED